MFMPVRADYVLPVRQKRPLLASCAIAAIAVAGVYAPARAIAAPGFQGTPTVTHGTGVTISPDNSSIDVGDNVKTIINWSGADNNFLPNGNSANFNGNSDYIVLNRIMPVNNAAPVQFNGTVTSTIGGEVQGGQIWFYSPTGIMVGSTGRFDVGSLLLTANNITDASFLGSGAYSFATAPNSTAAVEISPGAQLNALGPNSYVALIAPRVHQSGHVTVNGSAAYVGAERADVTIDGSLFSISFPTGGGTAVSGTASGTAAVVHDGTTTIVDNDSYDNGDGQSATGGPRQAILAAVPKNDAVTMLVTGDFGYTSANGAIRDGDRIILSGGYNVSDGAVDSSVGAPANANIRIADGSYGSNGYGGNFALPVLGHATGDATVVASNGDISFQRDLELGGDRNAGITIENGRAVTIGDDENSANLVIDALGPATVGTAFIDVDGAESLLQVFGVATVDASATANAVARAAFAGSASITATNGGDIEIASYLDVLAIGQGYDAGDGAGGNGTGGIARIMLTGGTLNVGDSIDVIADGYGGDAGYGAIGGFGVGKTASIDISAGSTLSGSDITVRAQGHGGGGYDFINPGGSGSGTGGSVAITNSGSNLQANGGLTLGADGQGGGDESGYGAFGAGGNGIGGSITLSTINGTSDIGRGITASASGYGGAGDIGGNGNGGTIVADLRGNVTTDGDVSLTASGIGGEGDSIGGNGLGGSIIADVERNLTINPYDDDGNPVGGDLAISVSGYGGSADDVGYGGSYAFGNGFGGAINFTLGVTGSVTVSNGLLFAANGSGFSSCDACDYVDLGGSGTGGDVTMSLLGQIIGANQQERANLIISAAGFGGEGGFAAGSPSFNGGAGTGGNVAVSFGSQDIDLETLGIRVIGNGGEGGASYYGDGGGNGGAGQGGTAAVTFGSGTASIGVMALDAQATGGAGGAPYYYDGGAGGSGGAGTAGEITVSQSSGSANIDSVDLYLRGRGGDGASGSDETGYGGGAFDGGFGGAGTGGTGTVHVTGGSANYNEISIDARGIGGRGGTGGYADDSVSAIGGAGGDAIGGTARLIFESADALADVDAGQIDLDVQAYGGTGGYGLFGGHGGNANAGTATIQVVDAIVAASQIAAYARSFGGEGGGSTNDDQDDSGIAGDASDGLASLSIDGVSGRVSAYSLYLDSTGYGGYGNDGRGGDAVGGDARVSLTGGGVLDLTTTMELHADSLGGYGTVGGDGTGGHVSVDVADGTVTTGIGGEGGRILLSAGGYGGGSSENGYGETPAYGNGTGGTVDFSVGGAGAVHGSDDIILYADGAGYNSCFDCDSGYGASPGGDGTGGRINVSLAGNIINDDPEAGLIVSARGLGGTSAQYQGAAGMNGGTGTGGIVSVVLDGDGVQFPNLDIDVSGIGGDGGYGYYYGGESARGSDLSLRPFGGIIFATAAPSGAGGDGIGGTITVSAIGENVTVPYANLVAEGIGGRGADGIEDYETPGAANGGNGGQGIGGSVTIEARDGGQLNLVSSDIATDGFGGDGGFGAEAGYGTHLAMAGSGGSGGLGQGGTIAIATHGGGVTFGTELSFSSDGHGGGGGDGGHNYNNVFIPNESGYGGHYGGDFSGGAGGNGGAGIGGDVSIAIEGGFVTGPSSSESGGPPNLTLTATGTGGDAGSDGGADSADAGFTYAYGGDGTGGHVGISVADLVTDGDVDAGVGRFGATYLETSGQGGSGGYGSTSYAGSITIADAAAAPDGELSFLDLDAESFGYADPNANTFALTSSAGPIRVFGDAYVNVGGKASFTGTGDGGLAATGNVEVRADTISLEQINPVENSATIAGNNIYLYAGHGSGNILGADGILSAATDIGIQAATASIGTATAGDDFLALVYYDFSGGTITTTGEGDDLDSFVDGQFGFGAEGGSHIFVRNYNGSIALNDGHAYDNMSLEAGYGTISSATALKAGGSITADAGINILFTSIDAGTDATLTAGGMIRLDGSTLNAGGDAILNGAIAVNGPGSVTAGGQARFNGAINGSTATDDSLSVSTGSGAIFAASIGGTTRLQSLSVSGAATLNGTRVRTVGNQSYGGNVTLGANVVMTGATGTFGGGVTGAGHDLTLNFSGTTALNGGFAGLRNLATGAGGTTTLAGSIATSGTQTYNDRVTLASATTLTSSGIGAAGNITFASTLDGAKALAVNTAGTTRFAGAVGSNTALASLRTNAGGNTAIDGGAVTTSGNQTYGDAVTLGADTVLTGASGTFSNGLNGGGHDLALNFSGTTAIDGGFTNIDDLSTGAGGTTTLSGAITTTGSQTYDDAVVLLAAVNLTGTTGTFANGVSGGGHDLALNFTGTTALNGNFAGIRNLSSGNGGLTTLSGSIATSGKQTYSDAVLLIGDTTLSSSGTGSAGNIVFGSTLDGGNALTVNTGGTTRFGDAVGATTALASLTTDAGGTTAIDGGSVITSGDQSYGDRVTLGTDTVLAGASGSFAGGLTGGGHDLALNFSGTTALNGNFAGIRNLSSGNGGLTTLAGSIATSGKQTYSDAVLLVGDTTLSSSGTGSAGNISFASTLDGGNALTVNTGGTTRFGGAVGATTALASLTTDGSGTTAVNGGSVTTSGDQSYGDGVLLGADTVLAGANGSFASGLTGAGHDLALNFTGTTVIDGNFTGIDDFETGAGGTTLLSGAITTTGRQTYNDTVSLAGDAVLTGSAGEFANGLTGAGHDLALNFAETTVLNGGFTGIHDLSTGAGGTTRLSGSITTTGLQTYGDAVSIDGNVSLNGSSVTFASTVDSATAGDLAVTADEDIDFAGAVGGVGPLGSINLTSGGTINALSLVALDAIQASGGNLDLGTVNAGGTLTLSGNDITLGDAVSGGGTTVTADGDIVVGTVNAGGALTLAGNDINIGDSRSGSGTTLTADGNIVVGTALAHGDFLADAAGSFTGGTVTTLNTAAIETGSIHALAANPAGNGISIATGGALTLGVAHSAGGVILRSSGGAVQVTNDLVAGGPNDASGRSVVLNAIGGLAVRSATATAGNVTIASGGNLSLQDADASGALTAMSGGLLSIGGTIVGVQINLASSDIAVGTDASVGSIGRTQGITITANGGTLPVVLGGSGSGDGYRLSNAELSRFAGGDIVFTTDGSTPLQVDTLSLNGSGASSPNLLRTLTINSGGGVDVIGHVAITSAGADNGVRVNAGGLLFVDALNGSIAVADAGGALAGTIDLNGTSILVASQSARADLANLTSLDARNARLAQNDGAVNMDGVIRANAIRLAAADKIDVQNTGGTASGDRAGLFAGAGGITLVSTAGNPLEVVINGRQRLGDTVFAGNDLISHLTLEAGYGSFAAAQGSTVNGCPFDGNGCVQTPQSVPFFAGAILTTSVGDVIREILEGDGEVPDTRPPSIELSDLISVERTILSPIIDEPVTGSGNDEYYSGIFLGPDEDDDDDDDDNANAPVTGNGNDALVNQPAASSTTTPPVNDQQVTGAGNESLVTQNQ